MSNWIDRPTKQSVRTQWTYNTLDTHTISTSSNCLQFIKWTIVQNMSTKQLKKEDSCCLFLHRRTKPFSWCQSIFAGCVRVFSRSTFGLWVSDNQTNFDFTVAGCVFALITHEVKHLHKISKQRKLRLGATFIKVLLKNTNALILKATTTRISY